MSNNPIVLDSTFAPTLSKRLRERLKRSGASPDVLPKHSEVLEDVAAALGWNGANALQHRLKSEKKAEQEEGKKAEAPLVRCSGIELSQAVLPAIADDDDQASMWRGRLKSMSEALFAAFVELRDEGEISPTADDAAWLAVLGRLKQAERDGKIGDCELSTGVMRKIERFLASLPGHAPKQAGCRQTTVDQFSLVSKEFVKLARSLEQKPSTWLRTGIDILAQARRLNATRIDAATGAGLVSFSGGGEPAYMIVSPDAVASLGESAATGSVFALPDGLGTVEVSDVPDTDVGQLSIKLRDPDADPDNVRDIKPGLLTEDAIMEEVIATPRDSREPSVTECRTAARKAMTQKRALDIVTENVGLGSHYTEQDPEVAAVALLLGAGYELADGKGPWRKTRASDGAIVEIGCGASVSALGREADPWTVSVSRSRGGGETGSLSVYDVDLAAALDKLSSRIPAPMWCGEPPRIAARNLDDLLDRYRDSVRRSRARAG